MRITKKLKEEAIEVARKVKKGDQLTFMEHLGVDLKTASRLIDILEKEGYITTKGVRLR